MNIFSVLTLIGGLAFFLYGMNVMSGSLEKMAGGKLELLLKKMTANPFVSLALGTIITMAIQSSSATTVMIVGLVNSGIMDFSQTLHVIFGANIGTTITAWILSLAGIESDAVWMQMLKPKNFSLIFAMVGVIMTMACKNDRKRSVGAVLVGFAVLIFGMDLMSDAMSPLADSPAFAQLMTKFNQPLVGLAVGTVVTAIIQSSSASVGMLQALSLTGGISCGMAIPIIMGQNIGTCVTAMISSIGANTQAKRVAVMHVSINVLGTLIWLPLLTLTNAIFHFAFMNQTVTPFTIAIFHSIFNILTTAILMPFSKYILKLAVWVVKDKKTAEQSGELADVPFLDERLLSTPSVAIQECNNATNKMLELARENIRLAVQQFSHYSDSDQLLVLQTEEEIDAFEDRLSTYLVKLSTQALSQGDSHVISKMLHAVGDFERLGDHAMNLVGVAKEIHDKGLSFTKEAQDELDNLIKAIDEILNMTVKAYKTGDVDLAARVEPLEEVIDQLTAKMKDRHIKRLQQGVCTIEKGFIFSDLLNNYERISDHCSNIAVAVIEVEHDTFDAHRYLQSTPCKKETSRGINHGWFLSCLYLDKIDEVSHISRQHDNARRSRQLLAPHHTGQQQHTHQHRHDGVHREPSGEGDGGDEGGSAQDEEDVEDVAAHDVADGDVGVALPGGGEGGEQLGQGSAQRHDGQADEPFAHAKVPCQRGGGVHRHVTAPHDEHQTNDAEQEELPQRLGRLFFGRRLLVLLGHPEQVAQIEQESGPERHALPEGDLIACPAEEEQEQGDGDHIG